MQWIRSIRSFRRLERQFARAEMSHTPFPLFRITQAASVVNDENIIKILQSPIVTAEQWNYVRSNVISKYSIKPETVYLALIQTMQKFKIPEGVKALRLYNFLVENNYPLNPGAKIMYLKLCIQYHNLLMNVDTEQIKRVYDELSEDFVGSNLETRLIMLEALCFTDRWQEVFKILEDESLARQLPHRWYTIAAFTAFYHKRFDLGWKYMNEAYEKNSFIDPNVFQLYLQQCAENEQTFKSNMIRCFQFLAKYGIVLRSDVAKAYMQKITAMGFSARYTRIFGSGSCESCDKKLQQVNFSKEELDRLADVVFECITGKDIYLNTKPDELRKFKNFIDESRYDIVMDGLNVFYKLNRAKSSRLFQQLSQLAKLSDYPPLIISRLHVKNNSSFKRMVKDLNANAFYVDNHSCDDLFFIYAALRGGPNAKLISGDLIRNHTSTIEKKNVVLLFTRWILAHRYIMSSSQEIIPPPSHDSIAQNSGGVWHLPYTNVNYPVSDYVLGTRTQSEWLCVKL